MVVCYVVCFLFYNPADSESTVNINATEAYESTATSSSATATTQPVVSETAKQTKGPSSAVVQTKSESKPVNKISKLVPISQYPELPTGCEMTSLTMVLNFYGLNADKCDISDNYLDKGSVGTVDFHVAFEGDPRDGSSYGCYAPVVVNTANRYLSSKQSSLKAYDMSNTELEELFKYIDSGVPVIVWGTQDCKAGYNNVSWNVGGKELNWITPEHCMVLVGYDDKSVSVADPIYGDVRSYDRQLFKSRYATLYKQAVVIK